MPDGDRAGVWKLPSMAGLGQVLGRKFDGLGKLLGEKGIGDAVLSLREIRSQTVSDGRTITHIGEHEGFLSVPGIFTVKLSTT